jgi:Lon protease-like protein
VIDAPIIVTMSMDPLELAFDRPVAVFPLPNVVLFPGGTQPLHVFEPRYRQMTRDALAGSRLIAMALLRPGYEAKYYTNHAEVHPIVCVGKIREHVTLPDGRYLLILKGLCRARIINEDRHGAYRRALLAQVPAEKYTIEGDNIAELRSAVSNVLSATPFDVVEDIDDLRKLLRASAPLGPAVDILAHRLVPAEEVEIRQRMLEETDLQRRSCLLLDELRRFCEMLRVQQRRRQEWPRRESAN